MESNSNQHLEMAELARLLEQTRQFADAGLRDAHPHLAECGACREQFEALALLDTQLSSMQASAPSASRPDCPSAEIWGEIAGGLTAPEEALAHIGHASGCNHCGPRLRAAVEELIDSNADLALDLTAEEQKQIANLESAKLGWQIKLAERISGTPHSSHDPASWLKRLFSIPRFAAASGVAAVLVAVVMWWPTPDAGTAASANQLLARAYSDQRMLELRIPGAEYAPLRVQRGPAASFIARPAALLKAEALIAAQLSAHPDDAAWLQSAARANMLEGKYDAALESLQRALELRPHSPELLSDLATAHFQRAQSEDRQEDYGAAFEYFSQVLAVQPQNATALFNRAIVAEHQFLYQQAVADWDHYLKLDSHSKWAEEARNRAEAARAKLKEHESGAAPLLSPEQVAGIANGEANPDAYADVDRRVEQYLDVAIRSWLPQAYPESGGSGDRGAQQALFFLGDLTAQKHNDRWLSDLLGGSSSPAFSKATAALALAAQGNASGTFTASREQAVRAADLFRTSGNQAGALRAQFEQAYSEQRTLQTDQCRRDATRALADAEALPYSWLQIQLGLEKGVCSLLGQDDWGADERISRRAMDRAQQSGYDGLFLRALYFVADDQVKNGDLAAGLKSVAIALQSYWSSHIPAIRAYALYDLLGSVPEFATNRPHLLTAIWGEAIALVDSGDDLLLRARAHSFAARAAAAAHQPQAAEREYAEASRLFALAPQTEESRGYVLANEIRTAQFEARSGEFDSGIARLAHIQDEILPLPNKYLVEMFYATLGELQLRSHQPVQAEQAFRPALESAERRLSSLNSEAERINWSKEAAPVYLGMAEAELVQNHPQESLEYFEWYLGAASRSGKVRRNGNAASGAVVPSALANQFASRLPLLSDTTVLAYGALPDGVAIWSYDNRGVSAQWLPQSNQDLQELAARFYSLASDPKSEVTALQRDSRSLYATLIGPLEQRLEPGRTLVIEADGWLAQVPFEALLDSSGHYLIERAAVVHSLGQSMDASLHEDAPISNDLHALIVGSAASSETEGLASLPDAVAEANAVAKGFHSSVVLKGSEATLAAVERDLPAAAVFHFAGHSLARPNGAALMLAAGPQSSDSKNGGSQNSDSQNGDSQSSAPLLMNADRLRHLDLSNIHLAVLSTCNAESGSDGARGFNSIAEALQRDGVPHVVASRWAVDSVETREFVESFYRIALAGNPVSESIRQTSRNMMADRRTSHPYYWSAFSAYGRP